MYILERRHKTPEILDGKGFTEAEYAQALEQLSLVNRLSNTHGPTCKALMEVAKATRERPLRILEIGFGYGDGTRALANYARKHNIEVIIEAYELNPWATKIAQSLSTDYPISFSTQNVFELKSENKYHFITNTQMMHHLSDAEIITMLKWMTQHVSIAWFINDLHRHWLAYKIFKPLAKVLGFNEIIQKDGMLSIAKSFIKEEWIDYLNEAQLNSGQYSINWHWPFRYGITFRILQ